MLMLMKGQSYQVLLCSAAGAVSTGQCGKRIGMRVLHNRYNNPSTGNNRNKLNVRMVQEQMVANVGCAPACGASPCGTDNEEYEDESESDGNTITIMGRTVGNG